MEHYNEYDQFAQQGFRCKFKAVIIWKKDASGSWKNVVEVGVDDPVEKDQGMYIKINNF